MKRKSRSSRVILSAEGKVLKMLRSKHDLSMRELGQRLGYSDSYISQIENGRENPPSGEKLNKFLALYGEIGEKHFKQLCKDFKEEQTDAQAIADLLAKLSEDHLRLLRPMVEEMARTGRHSL